MRTRRRLRSFAIFVYGALIHSLAAEGGHGLRFPAEDNYLQPLAQRFEYDLSSPREFRIGDLAIDPNQIALAIGASGKTKNQMLFRWPAGLLKNGTLSILDSQGKAIWKREVAEKELVLHASSRVAQFTSEALSDTVLLPMTKTPFITFCISKVTVDTKVYVCTRELGLSVAKGTYRLQVRDKQSKKAYVEINGKIVSPQGLVYLNAPRAELLLRAQLQSGESLELMTRRKSVEFLDVVQSEDPRLLTLTAAGAEPVEGESVRKLAMDQYSIDLPKEKPVYFLMAEGGIPLRQEFLLKSELPTEADRLRVENGFRAKTYARSFTLEGPLPEGLSVSKNDDDGEVRTEKNRYVWEVKNLSALEKNKRTLRIERDGKAYVAAFDVERGLPNELRLQGDFHGSSGRVNGSLVYRRWLEGLRWAVEASYLSGLSTPADEAKTEALTAGLSMRFRPGFASELNSLGLRFLYGQIKLGDESVPSPAVEAFFQAPWSTSWTRAFELRGRLWLGGGADFKLKSGWNLELAALSSLGGPWSLRWGLGANEWKTEPRLSGKTSEPTAFAGVVTFF